MPRDDSDTQPCPVSSTRPQIKLTIVALVRQTKQVRWAAREAWYVDLTMPGMFDTRVPISVTFAKRLLACGARVIEEKMT